MPIWGESNSSFARKGLVIERANTQATRGLLCCSVVTPATIRGVIVTRAAVAQHRHCTPRPLVYRCRSPLATDVSTQSHQSSDVSPRLQGRPRRPGRLPGQPGTLNDKSPSLLGYPSNPRQGFCRPETSPASTAYRSHSTKFLFSPPPPQMLGSDAAPSPINFGNVLNKAKDFFSGAGKCMSGKGIPENLQVNAQNCQQSAMWGPKAFAGCAGIGSIQQAVDAISCMKKHR